MLSSLKGFYQIEEHKTLIHTKKVKVSFSLHIYLCAITVHIYLPAVIHELENLWEKKKILIIWLQDSLCSLLTKVTNWKLHSLYQLFRSNSTDSS